MLIESFPILYLNLAGEMIYIIEQRLVAQQIESSKAQKVLNEIILAVYNQNLINEVLKPHKIITFAILRNIFEKLAHSSMMKLNEESMSKLFDLMTMVVKQQIFHCSKPNDLIIITDNHFISIVKMIENDYSDQWRGSNTCDLVNETRKKFLDYYQNFDLLELQFIRYQLLNFLKDIRTRVSIFLREGIQTIDGNFIIPTERVEVECECQIPGVIRYFQGPQNEIIETERFDVGGEYIVNDSRTKLGLNIYQKIKNIKKDGEEKTSQDESVINQLEIDLLAKLICKPSMQENQDDGDQLKFDFLKFENDNDDSVETNQAVQIINATEMFESQPHKQLTEIIKDLNELDISTDQTQENSNENLNEDIDFLELMDS